MGDAIMADSTTTGAGGPRNNNSCRMYEEEYPEVDQLVMVLVRSVTEMGAYVSLLEYNNIEGMILLTELSRKRIRSIPKLIRVGRNEVVVVVRVDKEKGYIDLSKRRVAPEDYAKCEEKYQKSKTVHSIMNHVAQVTDSNLEELYQAVGWPLYQKFGHAFDAFKLAITEPDRVFEDITMSDEVKDTLLLNIRRRLTPQPHKLRADLEVTCFTYEGIESIKRALRAGEDMSTEEHPLKVKLVAPPLYVMVTTSLQKESGLALMQSAIARIEEVIDDEGGNLNIKVAPRAVSERDERDLSTLMEELEKQNAEVDGDDDVSSSDDDA